MRICIANHPRCYREAIAAACRAQRPCHEVLLTEPDELDELVVRLAPDVVICSRATSIVRSSSRTWIVLYPEDEPLIIFSIDGEEIRQSDPGFSQIIALIDETERRLV